MKAIAVTLSLVCVICITSEVTPSQDGLLPDSSLYTKLDPITTELTNYADELKQIDNQIREGHVRPKHPEVKKTIAALYEWGYAEIIQYQGTTCHYDLNLLDTLPIIKEERQGVYSQFVMGCLKSSKERMAAALLQLNPGNLGHCVNADEVVKLVEKAREILISAVVTYDRAIQLLQQDAKYNQ